jgi:ankyrin repeat protein
VELLLRHGADANATDKGGNTALHWAAFKGFTGIAARLLSAAVPSLSIRNEV